VQIVRSTLDAAFMSTTPTPRGHARPGLTSKSLQASSTPPSRHGASPASPIRHASARTRAAIEVALDCLDPDLPYASWFKVAAVLHNELGRSEDTYQLFDRWSSSGHKYVGEHDTRKVWKALRPDHPRPSTLGTLIAMLAAEGHDWEDICAQVDAVFARDPQGDA
jgi:hypothetical protein